ncbi:MAG: hypothetical protein M3Y85_06880, partial [Bacteroidota bacterium]|nr:hypothetical protein [Bacteroidota bacterium]
PVPSRKKVAKKIIPIHPIPKNMKRPKMPPVTAPAIVSLFAHMAPTVPQVNSIIQTTRLKFLFLKTTAKSLLSEKRFCVVQKSEASWPDLFNE